MRRMKRGILFTDYNKLADGYTKVGEIEENLPYEFNTFLVVRDREGRLFWVTDSGCSCPTPFEETMIEDLKRVWSRQELREAITAWCDNTDLEDVSMLLDKAFPVRP